MYVAIPSPTMSVSQEVLSQGVAPDMFIDKKKIKLDSKLVESVLSLVSLVGVTKIRSRMQDKGAVKTGIGQGSIYAQKAKYSVTFDAHKDYVKYLDKGVKPHPMKYLAGKAIPLIEMGGKLQFAGKGSPHFGKPSVFFRKVTAKAIKNGSWFHPGIKPMNFIEEGVKDAIEEIKGRFPSIEIQIRALPNA